MDVKDFASRILKSNFVFAVVLFLIIDVVGAYFFGIPNIFDYTSAIVSAAYLLISTPLKILAFGYGIIGFWIIPVTIIFWLLIRNKWGIRHIRSGIKSLLKRASISWEFKRLYKAYRNELIRNKIVDFLDRADKNSWRKRRVWPDRFPEFLRENIVYLFSLSNYLKRFYIWQVKASQVHDAEKVSRQMWGWISPHWSYYENYKRLLEDIHSCRDGGKIQLLDNKGNVEKEESVGLFPAIKEFCDAVNGIAELIADIQRAYISADYISDKQGNIIYESDGTTPKGKVPLPKTQLDKFNGRLNDARTGLGEAITKLRTSHKELKIREKVLGNLQVIKAWTYLILDQCNPYGEQEHQYRFVPSGTRLVDQFGNETTSSHELEVDIYGNVLEDVNSNKDRFYDMIDKARPLKKVAPEEILAGKIKLMSAPYEIFALVANDWQGGFNTMRWGQFKEYSKSFKDYDAAMKNGKVKFYVEENTTFTPGTKTSKTATFDRRAKVDTGLMKYPGRINIHHTFEQVVLNPMKDLYPGVSMLGMSNYIKSLVEQDTENIAEMNKFLESWIQDIGKDVKGKKQTPETFKPLSVKTKSRR